MRVAGTRCSRPGALRQTLRKERLAPANAPGWRAHPTGSSFAGTVICVGRRWQVWVRRSLLGLVVVLALLALFDVFGQSPSTTSAAAAAATLHVDSPGAAAQRPPTTRPASRSTPTGTSRTRRSCSTRAGSRACSQHDRAAPVSEASRDGRLVLSSATSPPARDGSSSSSRSTRRTSARRTRRRARRRRDPAALHRPRR